MKSAFHFVCLCFALAPLSQNPIAADEYLNGIKWEPPAIITVGDNGVPSDAIVLFDGTDLSSWENADNWEVEAGAMISGKGDVRTKESFGDCQLHIEWSAPTPPKGSGQGRGNSGIFLMNNYEIQVLDSYDNETYFDGQAGAIYKQTPPQVNATRPPGEWNVYDIIWTAPRFNEDGTLQSPAFITALHNGVLILNHFQLKGDTPFTRPPQYNKHADRMPIRLQDHGNPVSFRNIWIREIKDAQGEQEREPFLRNGKGEERPIESE
ncbi:MAG: DUF1080 domain-containing protein [Planctomycetaceae bacterium]|nr:DUF1080 domain-containing protein [Planctomycetales bacterium]MCB9939009.1 DUF1080 domain-containing protein [Planctomycetaceae bacterium]